ncbi:radical SAM protein [bacterium]|nr:radical SAM protein [bacterium]
MLKKQYIKSAFQLFADERKKSSPNTGLSCVQKYKRSLPVGFCHSYPNTVSLKVTADCNLRCKHCYYSGKPAVYNPDNDFSSEDIFKLIDFLVDDLNILSLTLTGGEPFLRQDFTEIICHAKTKNLPLVIQTNGTILTERNIKDLSEILYPKTDIIHISLDGADRESHDSIRGKGAFDKTIKTIKLLRKYNLPVQINSTLNSASAKNLENLFELCDSLKVNRLSISKFHVCHENHKYLDVSLEDTIYCAHKIHKKMKENPHIFAKTKIIDIHDLLKLAEGKKLLDEYLEKHPQKLHEDECLSCHNHNKIVISAKGDIFLCSTYESEDTCLGNLRKTDFYEIWENRLSNPYFQKRDLSTVKCKDCKYIPLCGAGCPASAYKEYGDINYAPAECSYFKEYIRGLNG